jgi:hypothetical protein
MKTYNEYLEEYKNAIKEGLNNGNKYIIRENVYISARWQEDNNWNPWDNTAQGKLQILEMLDKQLHKTVVEGIEIMEKGMKNNG